MRNFVLSIFIGMLLGSCLGQSLSNKVAEPAVIGEVFLLDSNQTLKLLPNESWKAIGRPGWTTATGSIQVAGISSSLRMKLGDRTEFVFNVGNPEVVKLYQFTLKKSGREFEAAKVKNGFHAQRQYLPSIPTEITKYGESSYKLIPKTSLSAGEYAIEVSGKLFTFGIDQ